MLKITVHRSNSHATMELQGKLVGQWVKEALHTWTNIAGSGESVTADLSALTSVDSAGRRLLSEMHARGVSLVSSTLMTRGIIEEIAAAPPAVDQRT